MSLDPDKYSGPHPSSSCGTEDERLGLFPTRRALLRYWDIHAAGLGTAACYEVAAGPAPHPIQGIALADWALGQGENLYLADTIVLLTDGRPPGSIDHQGSV